MIDVKDEVHKYQAFWMGIHKSIQVLKETPKVVGHSLKEIKVKKVQVCFFTFFK
jgi:hypothetical protein